MLIQYHKVICQDVFKKGEKTGFRAKRKPLEGMRFPGVLQRRIKNGDINGMFHILQIFIN